jgi:hypothetical protein
VSEVPAGVLNVAENVVMGVLERAADTETATVVVAGAARCSFRAALSNRLRRSWVCPWRTSRTPLINWVSLGLVPRMDSYRLVTTWPAWLPSRTAARWAIAAACDAPERTTRSSSRESDPESDGTKRCSRRRDGCEPASSRVVFHRRNMGEPPLS